LLVTSAPATGVDSHLCLIFVSEVKPRMFANVVGLLHAMASVVLLLVG